jgi:hypothetical protein
MFADITRTSTPAIRLASEPRYKGISTANIATVKPTAPIAGTQRRPHVSKTTDTGTQSMRDGEAAATNNTTWSVIGR